MQTGIPRCDHFYLSMLSPLLLHFVYNFLFGFILVFQDIFPEKVACELNGLATGYMTVRVEAFCESSDAIVIYLILYGLMIITGTGESFTTLLATLPKIVSSISLRP